MAESRNQHARRPSRRLLESIEKSRSPSPVPGVSRGRGRGRGQPSVPKELTATPPKHIRGKGRGKGKGKAQPAREEYDYLAALQAERQAEIKLAIGQLTEDNKDELLVLAAERDPLILGKIKERGQAPESPPQPPSPSGAAPSWCVCSNCRDMPTDMEKKCCRKTPPNCTSESQDFRHLVLDPMVLHMFKLYRADIFALHNLDQGGLCKENRHAAYRCYILWSHGRLIAGDRRVIPSCCVLKIRQAYPDPNGNYTGFIRGRLG